MRRGWGMANNVKHFMGSFRSTVARSWVAMPLKCDNTGWNGKIFDEKTHICPLSCVFFSAAQGGRCSLSRIYYPLFCSIWRTPISFLVLSILWQWSLIDLSCPWWFQEASVCFCSQEILQDFWVSSAVSKIIECKFYEHFMGISLACHES